MHTWIVLSVLAAALLLFVTEWLRVDIVALGVVVALALTGVLTAEQAFEGFSNPAVLTIAALFVIAGAATRSGVAATAARWILHFAGGEERRLLSLLMLGAALLSSVMSDTGTVAVMLPAVVALARRARIPTSRLLIPLSFGALLGGAATQIGTPPNIIVSDLLQEAGLRPFHFFSFTPVGVALILGGTGVMVLFGPRLLPTRQPQLDSQRVETPEELVRRYRLPEGLFRVRVRQDSKLAGLRLTDAALPSTYQVRILEVRRGASNGVREVLPPHPGLRFEPQDLLIVQGAAEDVARAAARWDLAVQPAQAADQQSLLSDEVGVAEAILPPRSSLVGKTIQQLRFGTEYGLTVLGLRRAGVGSLRDLKITPLQFGDILLVQGPWRNILALRERPVDFVVTGQPEAAGVASRPEKAPLVIAILAGMLAILIAGLLPLPVASWLAALAIVLSGCMTMDEAYRAIDWRSLLLVAGMLPMSTALMKVGLVDLAALALAHNLGSVSPLLLLAGLFVVTALFTQLLSNTATTVLIAPIALAAAQAQGLEPHALLMAVAIAASAAFASPVASPVNTLVMAAGGYRFGDYLKAGLPLIGLALVASVLLLPLLFPF